MATPTPRRSFRVHVPALLVLLLAVSLPGFGQAQAEPPRITITDLGGFSGWHRGIYSSASGINEHGQVVGSSVTATGDLHAFVWHAGTMIDLGALGERSDADDINEHGQIVGTSKTPTWETRGVLWQNGILTELDTPAGNETWAYAINNHGQIVGDRVDTRLHAVLWQNGSVTDLGIPSEPNSTAYDINDHGQIVGRYSVGGSSRAFMWENGSITDLPSLGGDSPEANAINEGGQIVGASNSRAVLWQDGGVTDLGTLPGHHSSVARDINEQGEIVGTSGNFIYQQRAVLWEQGRVTDLGTLGGAWSEAFAINNRGQIVGGSGTATGEWHAVLWTISRQPPSPAEQIATVRAEVQHLLTTNVLNKGQAKALTTKLDGALAKLDRGNKKTAANQLHAFVNQVEAFRKARKLTQDQAQSLKDQAWAVINHLRQ